MASTLRVLPCAGGTATCTRGTGADEVQPPDLPNRQPARAGSRARPASRTIVLRMATESSLPSGATGGQLTGAPRALWILLAGNGLIETGVQFFFPILPLFL